MRNYSHHYTIVEVVVVLRAEEREAQLVKVRMEAVVARAAGWMAAEATLEVAVTNPL